MTTEHSVPSDIIDAFRTYERILLIPHIHPDGDALGSCLALAWALRAIDRQVLICNADGVPAFLSFLALPCPVLTGVEKLPCEPDLAVVLDCGDEKRVEEGLRPLLGRVPTVCIDHHLANPAFASVANWIDPAMSSTGEMIALIVRALNVPLQGALAEALYVAISTDTGNFSYGNTTPGALAIASELRANGLNIAALRDHLENNWSEAKLRFWGRLMRDARILEEGKFAAVLITKALMEEYGVCREDSEGFVEQLRRLHGVRVTLLLREEDKAGEKEGVLETKVSMRSSGEDNVRDVVAQVGGGGHRNAAGATLPMDAESAFSLLYPLIRSVWNG